MFHLRLSAVGSMVIAIQLAMAQFQQGYTLQIRPMRMPTGYPPLNPDLMRVGETTTITSGTSTITQAPTSTTEAPWDIVTATADAEGVAAGDYIFALSDPGKEKLGEIFEAIEAACGLPVRRSEGLAKRQNTATAECARDFLTGSEVAAWDAGMSTSVAVVTMGDVAVAVQYAPAAVIAALGLWLIGKGRVPLDESAAWSNGVVTKVDNNLVNTGLEEEPEDEPPLEIMPSAGHSFTVASNEEDDSAAQSILDWRRAQPWAVRFRTHAIPLADPICQESPFWAPIVNTEEGKMDVSEAIQNFCDEKAGEELTTDVSSIYKRYDLDDHSFWISASIWDDPTSLYCDDYKFVDKAECSMISEKAFGNCANEGGTDTNGGEAYGECVRYTIILDPSMTNTEPPSWEDANGGEIGPIADEIVNNCLEAGSVLQDTGITVNKFTYQEAEYAIGDFCGHSEDELALPDEGPVWKAYKNEGNAVQVLMEWARSGQDGCNRPQDFSNRVSQEDCRDKFMLALNNCNQDTITDKYGNHPLTWNSEVGCIDFVVYGDAPDWSCDHGGVLEAQCDDMQVQLS